MTTPAIPAEGQANEGESAIYRPVPLRTFRRDSRPLPRAVLVAAWLATLLLSVGLGLASILFKWSGLPLHFGGLDLHVTVYPPLVFCALWTLWFGFWWGFLPAYLATLTLALYSGMPPGWSLLFAFADPLALAVFAIAYRAIPIRYDLRSLNSAIFFVMIAFVGGVFGSTGSFIWTHTNALGEHQLLPIWQGWWLGAFLQNLFLVAPLLFLFTPAVTRWRDRHLSTLGLRLHPARAMLLAGTTIVGGVLIYLHFTVTLAGYQVTEALQHGDSAAWHHAARVMAESTSSLYRIVVILILFIAFFGGQLFSYWTASLRRSARELAGSNARLQREVEQRRRTEQELQGYTEQLELANSCKDRLFSVVAHDLRSPLSAAVALLQLTQEQVQTLDDPELTEHFDLLQGSMEQLLRLLENLLQWSRLQQGHWRSQPLPLALADAADTAAETVALRAAQKEVSLVMAITPALRVHADLDMLQVVLRNLYSNAVKFTPAGGQVTTTARSAGTGVELTVRDAGVGMTREAVERLFDTGQIHSAPGTAGEQGTGLGLVLCKELLAQQGGTIRIESRPGSGTAVHIILPAPA